uniref:Large membrane protein n=1 Tax=Streptomyces sp. NBC_01393 TaxID=2903851 RepID=A0AAU3IDW5_9ACTN
MSVAGPVPGPFADDGAGRARRRRTPMAVASVVAAVLLVGGGGAYVAATASGGGRSGTPAADGTPPRLALDGYAAATTGNGSTGGTAGIAPGEPNPYGTTYRASGTLPAGPGSAHVRWAEGKVTRAEVTRLAKALGLAGTPRLAGDAWTVGTAADGTEPNLRVTADAPGTWTFSSSLPGGDNCTKVTVCELMGSGSESDSAPGPVSEAAAERAAAPVLKAVGQDDAKLDASQLMNRVRVVNADPVVGGLPTYGWTTGLQIGPDGHVVGGSGQLKTPVEGDAYPVIGAKKTLDLMNGSASATGDRRMGIGGCASPVPLKDRDETPCEHPSPAPKAEAVTVEKATFGLAAQRANGRQALVPSWLFEVRSPGAQDTYTVTHPAVEPAFLASPESPAPPSADPTQPPGQPSSPAATRDVGVQGYTADGRDLTVSFTGGVCADYTVSASESSGKVTVTVTEKPWKNKVCIMIAKIYEKTVRLDEPLGGREVVGSDGKAVHHGRFGIPEPSAATSAGPR